MPAPRFWLPIAWLICSLGLGCAGAATAGSAPAVSYSGQFVVRTIPSPQPNPPPPFLETNRDFVRLDAALVPVSCERIKQDLCRQLGANSSWQGRIYVLLYRANSEEDPVTITSERFSDGWQYQLTAPDFLERSRYVQSLVQVLLLEMANRSGPARSAEIPSWLSEGLSQELLAVNEAEIILPPPSESKGRYNPPEERIEARWTNSLARAHQVLCANTPLTFNQLSWPDDKELTSSAAKVYRSSAQLFVKDLLRLPNGPACLRTMLTELPRYYNWQFAFFHAYQPRFQRPIDVEKWWSLQLVHFTGHELAQTWPSDEGWHKLDEIIRSAVQVRVGTNEMPLRAQISLQTIIQEWDGERQTGALVAKIREMDFLSLRMTPELAGLVREYRHTLAAYLQERDKGGFRFNKKATQRRVAEEAIQTLNSLDARRLAMRPASKPAVAVASPTG